MKFIAENDTLTIKLEGFEIMAGFRRKIVIPKSKITNLAWEPQFSSSKKEVRLGGTGLPGVLYAGNWLGRGHWYYLYVKRPRGYPITGSLRADNVLTIKLNNYPYKEIWLTCQPGIGKKLVAWWKG